MESSAWRVIVVAFSASVLTSCGGGGGASSPSPPPVAPPPPVPSIASITPSHAAYGQSVVLAGSNLTQVSTAVTFNGVPGQIVQATDTSLTVVVPAQASTGLVVATGSTGQQASAGTMTVDPFGPAIVIGKGGTYAGNWQSLDPKTPAVDIQTTDPVVISNCKIQSAGTLINATVPKSNVTIKNCRGLGLDPMVSGKQNGSFLYSYQISSLVAEHNYMEKVNFGFILYGMDGITPSGPISIRYNSAKNLMGLASDGLGGRITMGTAEPGDNQNHFVIVATMQGMTKTEVSWNYILSEADNSSIGDVINMFSSSGTPSTPIDIHDNFIQGGYPYPSSLTQYFAGGIITDGRATDTASTATAFVNIHDNQVVAHASVGISIAAGHDNEIFANRVVASGQFPDNSWYFGYSGISIINCACYNQPSTVFFNNFAHDNASAERLEWVSSTSPYTFLAPPIRNDYVLTDCAGGASGATSKCTNNLSLPDPVDATAEAAEYSSWLAKVQAAGVTIGPS